MKVASPVIETKSPDRSWLPSDEEIKAWLNSPVQSPTHSFSMDLICSETPYPCIPPLNVNQFQFGGSSGHQEWGNQD